MSDPERKNRLLEACMAILQATPEKKLGITLLNKALFYLDLVALRDLGRTVTGETFVALPAGPVVRGYDRRIVNWLQRDGLAEQRNDGMEKPVCVLNPLDRFEFLSEREQRIAETLAERIHSMKAYMISELSHENPGWIVAFREATGTPIDLHLALQQVGEVDDWLDEPADEVVAGAFQAAALEAGELF
jgi:hypothetical protein